jgi:hypothetical protein
MTTVLGGVRWVAAQRPLGWIAQQLGWQYAMRGRHVDAQLVVRMGLSLEEAAETRQLLRDLEYLANRPGTPLGRSTEEDEVALARCAGDDSEFLVVLARAGSLRTGSVLGALQAYYVGRGECCAAELSAVSRVLDAGPDREGGIA